MNPDRAPQTETSRFEGLIISLCAYPCFEKPPGLFWRAVNEAIKDGSVDISAASERIAGIFGVSRDEVQKKLESWPALRRKMPEDRFMVVRRIELTRLEFKGKVFPLNLNQTKYGSPKKTA